MNEPALTEAVKTDLPSPKPNRRKRLALRFAVLVVAVSTLGAAYWFTRPPELVWWRSPGIGKTGLHLRCLVPLHWQRVSRDRMGQNFAIFNFVPVDKRPRVIRLIVPRSSEV